ncbi:MAG TPA: hypothetical protein VGL64_16230 [Amycolatopsis sp.]
MNTVVLSSGAYGVIGPAWHAKSPRSTATENRSGTHHSRTFTVRGPPSSGTEIFQPPASLIRLDHSGSAARSRS